MREQVVLLSESINFQRRFPHMYWGFPFVNRWFPNCEIFSMGHHIIFIHFGVPSGNPCNYYILQNGMGHQITMNLVSHFGVPSTYPLQSLHYHTLWDTKTIHFGKKTFLQIKSISKNIPTDKPLGFLFLESRSVWKHEECWNIWV